MMDTSNIYWDQESRHVSVSPHPTKTTRSARGLSVPSSGYRAAVTVTWWWSRDGTCHASLVTLCPRLVTLFTWSHITGDTMPGAGHIVYMVTHHWLRWPGAEEGWSA